MCGCGRKVSVTAMAILYLIVSFGASVIGGICGIGGGVIIKPVLDMTGIAGVATISFLSSCTVLSMSLYNVARSLRDGKAIDTRNGTPLAIGAAVGGIAGNQLFAFAKSMLANDGLVRGLQALCLLILTLGTLIYTVKKNRIQPRPVQGLPLCAVIGVALGGISSFLGIGGGPFNLVVLHYFFGMETKKAAANSLYIILFSQITNVLVYILCGTIPVFSWLAMVLMVAGGISGAQVGRSISRRLDNAAVDKLFIGLMVVIMIICVYNMT